MNKIKQNSHFCSALLQALLLIRNKTPNNQRPHWPTAVCIHYCAVKHKTYMLSKCTYHTWAIKASWALTCRHFMRKSRTDQLSLQPPCWTTIISLGCVCVDWSFAHCQKFPRACHPQSAHCGCDPDTVCLITTRSQRPGDKLAVMMLLYMSNYNQRNVHIVPAFLALKKSSILLRLIPCSDRPRI